MKVVTEILQDLEILKRLLKHNANLKIRINYYLTGTHGRPDLYLYDKLTKFHIFTGDNQLQTIAKCGSCRSCVHTIRKYLADYRAT